MQELNEVWFFKTIIVYCWKNWHLNSWRILGLIMVKKIRLLRPVGILEKWHVLINSFSNNSVQLQSWLFGPSSKKSFQESWREKEFENVERSILIKLFGNFFTSVFGGWANYLMILYEGTLRQLDSFRRSFWCEQSSLHFWKKMSSKNQKKILLIALFVNSGLSIQVSD